MFSLTRSRQVLGLALPMMGGMLSQSVMSLIDALLVGRLGDQVLAGVGVGGYAIFMLTALLMGLSSGVQAQVAHRHGARQFTLCAQPLGAALSLALGLSLLLMLLGGWYATALIALLNPVAEVQIIAQEYFTWRLVALLPVAMTLCFRGYWHGIYQSGLYLRITLLTHGLNLLLSLWLIHGGLGLPPLGAMGAALGTSLSVTCGALIWAYLTWRHVSAPAWPSQALLSRTLRLALPNSLQHFLFAVSYLVLFWFLGQINTASVAVGHVLVHLSLLLILPGVGLGLAAMTLVGHSLGAGQKEEAYRWGWDAMRLASLILAGLALPMCLFPEQLLGLFLHDPELIALGRLPLIITGIMVTLDAAAIVFNQALQGAGAQKQVMWISLSLQWLFFLPLAWWVGLFLGYGLLGIWCAQGLYRLVNSSVFIWLWRRRRWQGYWH